jgi:hypothetical protein
VDTGPRGAMRSQHDDNLPRNRRRELEQFLGASLDRRFEEAVEDQART